MESEQQQLKMYVESFVDPFDARIAQPKLLDGRQRRSAGLRLRSSGELTCSVTGTTYIALIPGFANAVCWADQQDTVQAADVAMVPNSWNGHISSDTDLANIKFIRSLGAGLKLNLINSADNSEGYWEAIRVPVQKSDLEVASSHRCVLNMILRAVEEDFSQYEPYQSGKLRDIHRFLFKLNSNNTEHEWIQLPPVADINTTEHLVDNTWDAIIIKLKGRKEATIPSIVKYDAVSLQEVVYKENTSLARLQTYNIYVKESETYLDRVRFKNPAMQIE